MDCPAVIDELKEEAAKRGEYDDGAATVDDGDKRKWMSTAQLWVDSDAKSDEVVQHRQATLLRYACCFSS
jgi:Holliday junction resolvase-like predicted endonuclease